jgi:hypothetical protein
LLEVVGRFRLPGSWLPARPTPAACPGSCASMKQLPGSRYMNSTGSCCWPSGSTCSSTEWRSSSTWFSIRPVESNTKRCQSWLNDASAHCTQSAE